ncbi:MAG: hypothetical protein NVS1B11_28310 [Terriglobales bacterium]
MTLTRSRRLAYAFFGLLAGDAALLLYMLLNALIVRGQLLAAHEGELYAQVAAAVQLFFPYAVASLVGSLLVGVPVALLLPAHFVTGGPWSVVVALGALLGVPALVLVLLALDGGRLVLEGGRSFLAGTGPLFILSILVSTVSLVVYISLLRNQLRYDG